MKSNNAPSAKEVEAVSCWQRVVEGRRLHPQFIIRSVSADSLEDCKQQCEQVLFNCELVAYGSAHLNI
jgi:hypothetical protein